MKRIIASLVVRILASGMVCNNIHFGTTYAGYIIGVINFFLNKDGLKMLA